MTTYLEFDSSYRNRNEDPLASSFEMNIAQSGTKNNVNALDPVSNEALQIRFGGSFRNDSLATIAPIDSFTVDDNSDSAFSLVITTTAGDNVYRREKNFYVGAILEFREFPSGLVLYRRRVIYYEHINSVAATRDQAKVVLEGDIVNFAGTTTPIGQIENPSEPSWNVLPSVFVPSGTGVGNIENYYYNSIITNITRNESATITNYVSSRHLVEYGADNLTWLNTDYYSIRRVQPTNSGVVGVSTTTTVTLDATASSVDNYYVGGFLRIGMTAAAYTFPYDTTAAPYGEVRRIVSYDGSTRVATVQPAFTAVPTAPNFTYDVEMFTRDNYTPFDYIQTLQSTNNYEITLVNLVLPNQTLVSGKGGLISYYPYIYVKLDIISSSTSTNTPMYSNNPNITSSVTFKVIINDIISPDISPFVKIDTKGVTQTVTFSPINSLKITVFHSDGSLYQTDVDDWYGPSEANPLVQISAIFSIKRI